MKKKKRKQTTGPFSTNPQKASGKIAVNSNLMAVILTVFGIVWAFSPERLSIEVIAQFVLAIPLFYISSMAYTKIAYHQNPYQWDTLAWICGTLASALVLNIVGIMTYLLGYPGVALFYFIFLWSLLGIHTIINVIHNPNYKKVKIFKYVFFVLVQLIFGVMVLYI